MNKKIKAILIDDESNSRDTLKEMLRRYCDIEILGEADGVKTGLEMIQILKPNLVFLDIKMNDGSGFDLLKKVKEQNFHVIFTTAFDQFAIKAFRFSALDYLLKPIDIDELKAAVDKFLKRVETESESYKSKLDNLIHNEESPKDFHKVVFSTSEGMHIIEIAKIIRCEADDYYTKIHVENRKLIMVSKTLKEVESLLKGNNFIRNHKSHLVNLNYIKTYVKSDGGYLILNNGEKIPVSRRKKDLLAKTLSKF